MVYPSDGQPIVVNHFNNGKPSDLNGGEDVVMAYLHNQNGIWNDVPVHFHLPVGAICELKPSSSDDGWTEVRFSQTFIFRFPGKKAGTPWKCGLRNKSKLFQCTVSREMRPKISRFQIKPGWELYPSGVAMTRPKAIEYCETMGAALLETKNGYEKDEVKQYMSDVGYKAAMTWLGLDVAADGKITYASDGTPFKWTLQQLPTENKSKKNKKRTDVVMQSDGRYLKADRDNDATGENKAGGYRVICEKRVLCEGFPPTPIANMSSDHDPAGYYQVGEKQLT